MDVHHSSRNIHEGCQGHWRLCQHSHHNQTPSQSQADRWAEAGVPKSMARSKIVFQELWVLITVCLCGDFKSDVINAFIGVSLGTHIAIENCWRVHVPVISEPVMREHPLLRNFTKRSSGFQCLLRSSRFQKNKFSAACPIRLHLMENFDSIIAIVLLSLSWKALNR